MQDLIIGTDFSGLGSHEEAIKRLQVKHTVAFACDKDRYAKASYLANHKPDIFYDDIVTRNHADTPYCDGYFFGFPCQAFSIAGKHLGFEDTRGTLVFNSLEYIDLHRPRFFVAENVKGLLSHDKPKGSKSMFGKTFNVILDAFAVTVNGQHNLHKYDDCLNYHVYYAVLNSKNFGIPQNRERVFIVGFRDESDAVKFNMPKAIKLKKQLKDLCEPEVNEKYNLSENMIKWLVGHSEKSKQKGNGFNFNPTAVEGVAACVNSRVYKMGVDDNYLLVDKIKIVGKINCSNRLESCIYGTDGISPTIMAHSLGGSRPPKIKDGEIVRRLTPKECFRLQGYSDSFFDLCAALCSDTQLYRQAGNSITVDTIMYLIAQILKACNIPYTLPIPE